LTLEAQAVLRKYHPRIVAVTGTVGKTTTKDAIAAALSAFFSVRKSEKSFNSEIGVPLTILGARNPWHNPFRWFSVLLKGLFLSVLSIKDKGLKIKDCRYPHWLVLEVGADKPGDISSLAAWLCPDVSVITRFAEVPVHIESFPSVASLLEEKATLIHSAKEKGLVVLGSDDEEVAALQSAARGRQVVYFGTTDIAEVCGSHYAVRYGESGFPEGIVFRAQVGGTSLPLSVSGALGMHQMQPLLAACAVCVGLGLNLVRAAEQLSSFEPPRGRMRLLHGVNGSLIIDDSYNSSPVALREALAALASLEVRGRKIAVLGDMLELGEYSDEEHKKSGALAASSCDILCTVGAFAKGFAVGAREAGM
ncbi:MAG: Mur ligase family protein, partial [Patescibacteria group bacterium]